MSVAKAIVAGAIALVGGIALGYRGDEHLANSEMWDAIALGLVAFNVTYIVPNRA